MGNLVKLAVFGNYREIDLIKEWDEELRYKLAGIDPISIHSIKKPFDTAEEYASYFPARPDLILFDMRVWPRKEDVSLKNALHLLSIINAAPSLEKAPIALVYAAKFHGIDKITAQIPDHYKMVNHPSAGAKWFEEYADLVGKICADVLDRTAGSNMIGGEHRIYLCHASKDRDRVKDFEKDLVKIGAIVWNDEAAMELEDSLIQKITQVKDFVDFIGVVISKNSVDSPRVQKELEIAMGMEFENKETIVFPLLLDECSVPAFVQGKFYADISTPEKYQDGLNRIRERMLSS